MVDYSRYKFIKVEKKDKVAILTLNRPEALNVVHYGLHEELQSIFGDVGRDEEVTAVMLTGAGKAFSAGGDLKWLEAQLRDPAEPHISVSDIVQLVATLVDLQKPIIAAVNGAAIGLGANIALLCDIIIASEDARIADPHVSVGLVAGDSGCVIWPLLISMCRAKGHLMTGKFITGKEAEEIGLINKVVPADKVYEEAFKMAQELASGAVEAIKWTKVCLNKIIKERLNLVFEAGAALEELTFKTEDFREGATSFLERRPSQFKGK